jgi:cytochrome d ubiquinol oxidase subunit II
METVWFTLVAVMLIAYVVLDGFDLGAGALHLMAARTDEERSLILKAIGPVWDGNEVWLIAAGGTLFYAFPLLYASSFSGFYLPLNIVLWLLVMRALGIEFRHHLEGRVWREFFDGVFALSSVLLIVLFGAALGNVMRGVPLAADHYFFVSLWTNFLPGPEPGALDWYTVVCSLIAVAALTLHGALYLILKTAGPLNDRLRRMVPWLWGAVCAGTLAGLASTVLVRPRHLDNYRANAVSWVIPVLVLAAIAGMFHFTRVRRERDAFLASCAYISAMLGGAAFALYPVLLPSSGPPERSLTIWNAATGPASLSIGLLWWGIGMAIAIGYFVIIYRMFRGKVA